MMAELLVPETLGNVYLCLREADSQDSLWTHQGTSLVLHFFRDPVPLWLVCIIVSCCVCLSSLFNGLSLGLMGLDITELRVIAAAGKEAERRQARAILPVRSKGHSLLCAILLASTICNAAFTVLLENKLAKGWETVLVSTAVIVLLCEILPCALVSRFGLIIGSKTIWLTRAVLYLSFPVSYPVGKVLDLLLGKEVTIYTKERIKELVKLTTPYTQMKKQEVDIIAGALEMTTKVVEEAMTPIDDVYMLPLHSYLDLVTVADIMKSGYSRIPVFEGERSNIVGILYTKDLAILDPEDKLSLKTLLQLYNYQCIFTPATTTLDTIFQIFKQGVRGHMAFIYRSENKLENKVVYETIGIITMEDVIEELIQAEILDENDAHLDTRYKKKRERQRLMANYLSAFTQKLEVSSPMSEQLLTAAYQFLSNGVEPFQTAHLKKDVLLKLLSQSQIYLVDPRRGSLNKEIIFSQEMECFILILEGKVNVIVGEEKLKFEAGSFAYFGAPTLTAWNQSERPKYNYLVKAQDEVKYLKISKEAYIQARRESQDQIKEEYGEKSDQVLIESLKTSREKIQTSHEVFGRTE